MRHLVRCLLAPTYAQTALCPCGAGMGLFAHGGFFKTMDLPAIGANNNSASRLVRWLESMSWFLNIQLTRYLAPKLAGSERANAQLLFPPHCPLHKSYFSVIPLPIALAGWLALAWGWILVWLFVCFVADKLFTAWCLEAHFLHGSSTNVCQLRLLRWGQLCPSINSHQLMLVEDGSSLPIGVVMIVTSSDRPG